MRSLVDLSKAINSDGVPRISAFRGREEDLKDEEDTKDCHKLESAARCLSLEHGYLKAFYNMTGGHAFSAQRESLYF